MRPIVITNTAHLSEKMLAFTTLFNVAPHLRVYGELWPLDPSDKDCVFTGPDGCEVTKVSADNLSATIIADGQEEVVELLMHTQFGLCLADGRYLVKP